VSAGAGLRNRYSAALGGTATLVWAYRVVNRVEGAEDLRDFDPQEFTGWLLP